MATRIFCDLCGNEIKGENVGKNGWRVESGHFIVVVTVYKDGKKEMSDLDLKCLLKMLNTKPKRKYVWKQKGLPTARDLHGLVPDFTKDMKISSPSEGEEATEQVLSSVVPSASNNPVGTVPEPSKPRAKMPDELDPLASLVIRSATKDNPFYTIQLGIFTALHKTIKSCVLSLGSQMDWGIDEASILEKIKTFPESDNRTNLINILEGSK